MNYREAAVFMFVQFSMAFQCPLRGNFNCSAHRPVVAEVVYKRIAGHVECNEVSYTGVLSYLGRFAADAIHRQARTA